MLAVIRDPSIDAARRDRLAIAAAPYCHARLAEKTRKAAAAEAADKAGDHDWGDDLEYSGRSQ
jgi:phage terminase small subunit